VSVPPRERDRVVAHLREGALFGDVDSQALGLLVDACRLERARAGASIVEEGSTGEAMYALLSGRVRVEKSTPHSDTYTVTFLSGDAGDFFGELALLHPDKRSATVVAESDCEFVVIDRSVFLAFGDQNPRAGLALTRRIASSLALRLRRANQDVITLFAALVHEVEERI
jgi:CRP-like cAMP-binding protein